jgi:hypothetical protein
LDISQEECPPDTADLPDRDRSIRPRVSGEEGIPMEISTGPNTEPAVPPQPGNGNSNTMEGRPADLVNAAVAAVSQFPEAELARRPSLNESSDRSMQEPMQGPAVEEGRSRADTSASAAGYSPMRPPYCKC